MDKSGILPAGSPSAYYSFSPAEGYRVVVMDVYDWSVLGRDAGDATHREAAAWLGERNPNANKRNPLLLDGTDRNRRFTELGGAVGKAQLAWLERELSKAEAAGEAVIAFSHTSVHPDSTSRECRDACLAWNYDEILEARGSAKRTTFPPS